MTPKGTPDSDGVGRVRVPADLDRPDPILLGLSARQLATLTGFGLLAWTLAVVAEPLLGSKLAAAVVAAPAVLVGVGLAVGWRDGLSLDRLAVAGLRWWTQPRRRVVAPDGLLAAPGWAGPPRPRLAALTGPISGLHQDGVLELAGAGWALVCAADPVNLRLRTPAEQQQLLASFARFLHALQGPVQVVVRSQPADLGVLADRVRAGAGGLAHPALEQAALGHADWLAQLGAHQQLRHRTLLVSFHQPASTPDAAAVLARQVEQAAGLLSSAGITLRPLDADAAGRVLAAAASLGSPPRPAGLAPAGTVITGPQR